MSTIEDLGGGVEIAPDRGGWRWWAPLGVTGWVSTKGRAKGTGRQCATASASVCARISRLRAEGVPESELDIHRREHAGSWGLKAACGALLRPMPRRDVVRRLPVPALAAVAAECFAELSERPQRKSSPVEDGQIMRAAFAVIRGLPPSWLPYLRVELDRAEFEGHG